jgi:hypothetical protein
MNDGTSGKTEHHAHFAGFKVRLPRSRLLRLGLGIGLIVGGLFGFLPILGFWMLPLGIIVLAVDIPAAQRLIHWFEHKWHVWRARRGA